MADERCGFAGLDSLVSDLSDLPASPPLPAPEIEPAARQASSNDDDDGPDWIPPPKPKKTWSPKWIVAAFVVGGLIVAGVVNSNSNSSRSSSSSSYPPATYTPPAVARPTVTPAPQYTKPTVEPEERPPVGEGTVLSSAQLRYCLAQGARIDGANKAINTTSQEDIGRFNTLVDDFNARCGKTRYRTSTMQSVKADVEARRMQLEKEGAALFGSPYSR